MTREEALQELFSTCDAEQRDIDQQDIDKLAQKYPAFVKDLKIFASLLAHFKTFQIELREYEKRI